MFVRCLEDIKHTDRYRVMPRSATVSARYLNAADGTGYSLHVNRGEPIESTQLWYKNHWEANYLVSGSIRVTDMTSGKEWVVGPGDLYQVGPNDRHLYEVLEDEHHVSIFCPALRGDETHDEDGAYSPSGVVPVTEQRMFVRNVEQLRHAGEEVREANGKVRIVHALTAADGLGFSFSDLRLQAGATMQSQGRDYWETSYIVSGTAEVEELESSQTWKLEPDAIFNTAPGERFRLSARTDLHAVQVAASPG